MSEEEDSLVKYNDLPTPPLIQKAFERMSPPSARGKEGVEGREVYVNSQWALGGEGTGAPVSHSMHGNDLLYQFVTVFAVPSSPSITITLIILTLHGLSLHLFFPLYCTLLYSTLKYCTPLHSPLLSSAVLHCTVLYSPLLCLTVLFCPVGSLP